MWVKILMATAMFSMGCASDHIAEYKPKVRDYQFPVEATEMDNSTTEGSIWGGSEQGNYLYTDQRAIRPGDILTVRVEEFANAERATNTSNNRVTEMNADIAAFIGLMAKVKELDPDIEPSKLISASSETRFDQAGETGRSEKLTATVPVIVKKALPNGNVFVEGHRVILVNEEEHHFYISGVARPFDVDENNTIASSRLADAEIEFTGRGSISAGQKPGFFATYFGWIWPF
ncbi:MAG: flagellar basal body L-ring protein FlgH [bacterium]